LSSNQLEPLYQHEEGSTSWEKEGVDICEFSGKSYLITVDYFSNFIEVDLLTNTSAKQGIHCLKRHFARYGIPRCLHSDNAQQSWVAEPFSKWGAQVQVEKKL